MTIVSTTTYSTMEQPGRLFNKSLNLDSFFQEQQRRKLIQRNSFHDFDDIPATISATSSPMKPSGGANQGSPLSVRDVKHFEPESDFDNGIGGVAIDLCLSDEDCDDLSILEEEQQMHQEQQYVERLHATPRPTFLTPIMEERRVTFSAQHVVHKVDDAESCAIDHRYVHQVFDAVQVWFIPHHTAYSDEERSNMWYTREQMSLMKEEASEAKKAKRQEVTNNAKAREVETELDTCSLFPSFSSLKRKESESSYDVSFSRRYRYECMIDAVLLEQYEQRMMCLRVYGRVDTGYSGILDCDRLARVCAIAGDTKGCHERAVAKAKKSLEEDEDFKLNDDSSECSSSVESTSSEASAFASGSFNPEMKRSPSFNSSAIAIETSHCLNKGVSSIFRVLLSPFLEIREGNLFLGVGEEMSVMV